MRRGEQTTRSAWAVFVLFCVLLLVSQPGCDGQFGSQPGNSPTQPSSGKTIVSLTPALTQMLIDMGLEDRLVGVSTSDDKSLSLPRCGTYRDPLIDKILELEPAIVLTESAMADGSDVAPMLRSLAEQGVFELHALAHCRSVADVERALIDAEDGLGAALGEQEAAESARRLMSRRLELIKAVTGDADKPRVLVLIEPSTLGALGPGATHDEMIRLAGGVNAVSELNADYLNLTRSQVQETARPDVVLILEPNGSPITERDHRTRALDGLAVPAVMQRRIVVIDHPQAMLPSTSMPAVIKQMAKAIHPDKAQAIDKAYALAEKLEARATEQAGATP